MLLACVAPGMKASNAHSLPTGSSSFPPRSTICGEASGGMPPESAIRMLDWQYGENGRLIYNCEPYRWAGGGLCKNQ